MKQKQKLRLDTASLRVEVFPTMPTVEAQRGTVQGYESSLGGDCPTESWSGPVNCFCCGTNYDTECCHTDPSNC